MLFSVMSGRIRISRAARVIGASSAGPADSVGGLLSARVASFRQRLLERLEPGALAHHPSGAQELIDRDVRRHLDGQPRHVARRARDVPAELAHDEQRRLTLEPERPELRDERLGLAVGDVEHRYGRHDYFFSAAFCCAFVSFTLLRIITREPFAPGTAPRTRTRCCSGITRTTLRFSTVRRSPPIRPGR